MKLFLRLTALLAIAAGAAAGPSIARACTGITVRPRDGSIIFARTLEFAQDLQSNVIVVPRDQEFVGTAPGDKPGLRWKDKYGIVGMNAFGLPLLIDGLNEKGLHVGIFYFPGYAKYQAVTEKDQPQTISPVELPVYLLGTCATVDEAAEAAKNAKVAELVFKQFGFVPPMHFIVTDATGRSIVLEYVNGELKIHQNPLGVMSNAPTFDWHMTNLSNYIKMNVNNAPAVDIAGVEIKGLGQGSGMLGIPGDFTPPSRFIRAVAFSIHALPVDSAREGVLQAFHLLNQFDLPKGAARELDHGKEVADYTAWTIAADLKNLRYYFRTYENSAIRMVDLKAVDFDAKEVKTISIKGDEQIEDVSAKAN